MTAYYNEIEPFAVKWLQNLIAAGHIAPGIVDDRSIEDVTPNDLKGFTQCHFFAGIGVWSLALRNAGWDDNRPVWTASCPCQPFSAAGAGAGFADERHLWPALNWLIAERKPTIVLGEQVASKFAEPWVDLVHADMEALDYSFGCVPFPSASVGAPHIRDRNYWLAHAGRTGSSKQFGRWLEPSRPAENSAPIRVVGVGHARLEGRPVLRERGSEFLVGSGGMVDGMADTESTRGRSNVGAIQRGKDSRIRGSKGENFGWPGECARRIVNSIAIDIEHPGPTNGFWRDADWLACRDGKWRPVEPGSFPLAHGATSRVGRLRAYGNAINAEAARVFIQSVMSVLD